MKTKRIPIHGCKDWCACPTCNAAIGESCRTLKTGNLRESHPKRQNIYLWDRAPTYREIEENNHED